MSDAPEIETDLVLLKPTFFSRAAGAALCVSGCFTMLLGAQTWSLLLLRGVVAVAIPLMLLLGLGTLISGWKVTRLRGWAAISGTAGAALIGLLGMAWVVYTLPRGLVSLLALGNIPLGLLAAVLGANCIKSGLRADRARARLRDQGYETGS